MNEIYAKPIINDKLWVIEQDGEKIATLQKQENNKFLSKAMVLSCCTWFSEICACFCFIYYTGYCSVSGINIIKLSFALRSL